MDAPTLLDAKSDRQMRERPRDWKAGAVKAARGDIRPR
jgi:hypothetical protein